MKKENITSKEKTNKITPSKINETNRKIHKDTKEKTNEKSCEKVYTKNDLGVRVNGKSTFFKVWAPYAKKVEVNLYDDSVTKRFDSYNMKKENDADVQIWSLTVPKNLYGKYYTYTVDGTQTQDPYAYSAGVNGKRSYICNLENTNSEEFNKDSFLIFPQKINAIITETSVSDATADKSIKIPQKYRRKFLGLAEEAYQKYIKELGVTHVQLMPVFDFGSVDEEENFKKYKEKIDDPQYNWGYDPVNYFVLEGSYSTNPFDGSVRVREFKDMVLAFHKNGIGVILDVVFNHMFSADDSSFQKIAKDVFFRKKENGKYSNGSGCGNEVATEHKMVRKYIIDCLKFITEEYHIDGYRFDLMGCIDIETMNEIQRSLKKINPYIIIYGEGWNAEECALKPEKLALKKNVKKLNEIGVFSDDIRDSIKGHVFYMEDKGFVNGGVHKENDIAYSIVGAIEHKNVNYESYQYTKEGPWNDDPKKVINYVSCHDNYTLYDKLKVSAHVAGNRTKKDILMAQNRLAASIVFTSQGIPFFLQGEENMRSKPIVKGGRCVEYAENSYNMPIEVNKIIYDHNSKMLEYYKGLIAVRKKFKEFRLDTKEQIQKELRILKKENGVVMFRINSVIVIYNSNKNKAIIPLKEILDEKDKIKNIKVYVKGDKASDIPIEEIEISPKGKNKLEIPKISCFVGELLK